MSLNYSINNKYNYIKNEFDNQTFVFEISLRKFCKKQKIIRKIIKSHTGKLLSYDENIKYDDIDKICLSMININNPIKEINIKIKLDQNKKYLIYNNSNINLEFYCNSDFLECNYNIIN